jgi:two-component system, NtrC family, sensor histidine kinase HydH
MLLSEREKFSWMDLLWLAFLAGLAVLPPIKEIHKQLILIGIAALQFAEGRLIAYSPKRGRAYIVLLKILLSTLLLDHTGEVAIESSYYPIYYLPVVTAAIYYGPWGTLLWTAFASAAYCSYLYPALQQYELTGTAITELTIRILFFFLAGLIVNRFAVENRRQTRRYQAVAEELENTNRRLQQIQAEARRSERLAALGQLSAGLAHEIRNPLGVIKGSAEMLQQKLEESNPLASELASYISSEVNRLSALVTRFLDFARPLHLDLEPKSMVEIVDRALQSVAAQWSGPEIHVERAYESGLPLVAMDEDFCERVFVNLAQNAYEAMIDGGTLRVTIGSAERDHVSGVEVRFADTGPGVPDELREQIFNPFVTSKKSGVGLGLAIVSKIVDEHHGVLRLEKSASPGACFSVFFPAAGQAADATPARAAEVAGD